MSASTQNQALSALLFLYRGVLGCEPDRLQGLVPAKRPTRLPVVLSREEVQALLQQVQGVPWLVGSLLYGSGLRLLEGLQLRIKDVDFQRGEITVRDGKGYKDRITVFPVKLKDPLGAHIDRVREIHQQDLRLGAGEVEVPFALVRKYPDAGKSWGWQWVFPATRPYLHRETGIARRHHLNESVIQRAVKLAMRKAGLVKHATCHTLRHNAGSRIMPGPIADRPRKGGSLAA